jgi:hypothetical protein
MIVQTCLTKKVKCLRKPFSLQSFRLILKLVHAFLTHRGLFPVEHLLCQKIFTIMLIFLDSRD